MRPAAWTELRYHAQQYLLWHCKARTVMACAGRGSGKTELARRRVVSYLPVEKPWQDPKYFYALPTFAQAKLVAWEQLLALIPPRWLAKPPSVSTMIIETIFGSKLYVVGMDKPARIEGVQWDGGVVDESSDQKPGGFDRSIRPALTHREGWCWRIGVPKRFGTGAREFRHAYDRGIKGEADMQSFTWPSWDILPEKEIRRLQEELDPKDYLEQVGGNWVDAGGAAYYAFNKEHNIRSVKYDSTKQIVVGCDFNVDPMAWCIGHLCQTDYGQGLEVFDEIWLRNTNTQRTLDTLWERYKDHQGGWVFVGDPAGRHRHSSASKSDYAQIKNDYRFKAKTRFRDAAPAIKDRLASVNLLCCNAAQHRKFFVDPKCVHMIDDLLNRSLSLTGEPEAAVPGLAHDSGHMTDALGYLIYHYFPVRVETGTESTRVSLHSGPWS